MSDIRNISWAVASQRNRRSTPSVRSLSSSARTPGGGSRNSTSSTVGHSRGTPSSRAVAEAHRRQALMRENFRSASNLYADVDSDDEAINSECPIIDEFVEENGPEAYKAMMMFSHAEFERLWSIVGLLISTGLGSGRGPRCKNKPKDLFFIMINVLHTPTKWAKHGIEFGMKASTIEKQVWKVRLISIYPLAWQYVNDVFQFYLLLVAV